MLDTDGDANIYNFVHICETYVSFLARTLLYEGGSICNENPFITPSPYALGFYALCQTKDESVAILMVHKKLFYFSKFNMFKTF